MEFSSCSVESKNFPLRHPLNHAFKFKLEKRNFVLFTSASNVPITTCKEEITTFGVVFFFGLFGVASSRLSTIVLFVPWFRELIELFFHPMFCENGLLLLQDGVVLFCGACEARETIESLVKRRVQ